MHEHSLQSTVGVGGITELMVAVAECCPPRPRKFSEALVFSQGRPAVVNMQDEHAIRAYQVKNGFQHGASIGSAVDHPQRAEQANGMIHTLFGKATQFDQICLDGKYCASGTTGHEFAIHDFEHGVT